MYNLLSFFVISLFDFFVKGRSYKYRLKIFWIVRMYLYVFLFFDAVDFFILIRLI